MDIQEIWNDIPNYDGQYQVSNLGRVKSFKKSKVGKILKQYNDTYGYKILSLCKKSECKTFKIHKLVAIVFLGHTPNYYSDIVDHINNDKTDNRVTNLQITNSRTNNTKDIDRLKTLNNFTGVHYDKRKCKYYSRIKIKNKSYFLGSFNYENEASIAYQDALTKLNNNDLSFTNQKTFSSKYKRVNFHKMSNKWTSSVYVNGKNKYIGLFNTEEEAQKARLDYISTL